MKVYRKYYFNILNALKSIITNMIWTLLAFEKCYYLHAIYTAYWIWIGKIKVLIKIF